MKTLASSQPTNINCFFTHHQQRYHLHHHPNKKLQHASITSSKPSNNPNNAKLRTFFFDRRNLFGSGQQSFCLPW